jgi:hypothetical protein
MDSNRAYLRRTRTPPRNCLVVLLDRFGDATGQVVCGGFHKFGELIEPFQGSRCFLYRPRVGAAAAPTLG